MRSKPVFSIIIPTLNEQEYLPRLLTDLQKQTYTDFEVIVVDGQSTDKTIARAKKVTNINLRILSSPKGVSRQRNLGAKQARADWIIFFDADNQLPPTFLAEINKHLETKECDFFTTFIKPDSENNEDKAAAMLSNITIWLSSFLKTPTVFGAIIGAKKDSFEQTTGFDPNISFQEDSEFITRAVNQGFTFKVFAEPFIIFSFRRFRHDGTLNVIRESAKLRLNRLLTKNSKNIDSFHLYPMLGGSYYKNGESHKTEKISVLSQDQKQKIVGFLRQFTKLS